MNKNIASGLTVTAMVLGSQFLQSCASLESGACADPSSLACKGIQGANKARDNAVELGNEGAKRIGAGLSAATKTEPKGDEGVRAVQVALRDDANCPGANGKSLVTDGVKSNADGSLSNTEYAFESFQTAASEAGHQGVDFTAEAIKAVVATGVKCAPN